MRHDLNWPRRGRGRQPFEYELAQVERYQRNLEFLRQLNRLEQQFWQESQYACPAPDQPDIDPLEELALIVDQTRYLPCADQATGQEWQGFLSIDFINPELWAPLSQLKDKFIINSRRSFWRTIARLKEMGLRTLPARA